MAKEKRDILRERARILALPPKEAAFSGESLEIVEFLLANEKYAIESLYIREVYPFKDLTLLPSVPSFVRGVMNVRRKIVTVIDLRILFELPVNENNAKNKIIILANDEEEFAIFTEAVIGVGSVPFYLLQPSLPTLVGIREEFLKGVTADGLIVLAADKLISSKKLIVEESIID